MAKPIRLYPKPEKVVKERKPRVIPEWDVFTLYTKEERKELKAKVLELYESNIGPKEITKTLNIPINYVHRVVAKSSFRVSKFRADNIIGEVNTLDLKMNEAKSKVFVNCICCGTEKVLTRAAIKREYIDKQKNYICNKCKTTRSNSKKSLSIRNKTGYIGVQFKKYSKYFGVFGNVSKRGKILLSNFIHVDLNSNLDRALLDCAIKREIFIIENNHNLGRNFTNEELVKLMEKNARDDYNEKINCIHALRTKLGI